MRAVGNLLTVFNRVAAPLISADLEVLGAGTESASYVVFELSRHLVHPKFGVLPKALAPLNQIIEGVVLALVPEESLTDPLEEVALILLGVKPIAQLNEFNG